MELVNLSISFREAIEQLQKVAKNPRLKALPLPTSGLQSLLRGLRLGELSILGGFEGQGKSTLAQMIALHLAEHFSYDDDSEKRGVLYVSIEMARFLLVLRLIMMKTGLSSDKIDNPELLTESEWNQILETREMVNEWPLIINDAGMVDTEDIRKMIKQIQAEREVKFIVVDYLQLLADQTKSGNEVERLDRIVWNLKDIAKRFHCHILAISSLNRGFTNPDGSPSSRSFRGSGGIGFSADNLLLLYRPNMYNPNTGDYEDWKDYTSITVTKQRNGPAGIRYMKWDAKRLSFSDISEEVVRDIRLSTQNESLF